MATENEGRGPSIADARGIGAATGKPVVVVVTQDEDGNVLAAAWGEDRGFCKSADRLMRKMLRPVDGASGVAAERPDEDGEATTEGEG